MSDPIDRFLDDVADRLKSDVTQEVLDSSIEELRNHLSESATEIEQAVSKRELAEERAVREMGVFAEPEITHLKQRTKPFEMESRLAKIIFAVSCVSIYLALPALPIGRFGTSISLTPFVVIGIAIGFGIAAFNKKRIGLFLIPVLALGAALVVSILVGTLSSPVPSETGRYAAWRWELPAVYQQYQEYDGKINNYATSGYASVLKPTDISYLAGKSDMWLFTGGASIWSNIFFLMRMYFPVAIIWSFLWMLATICGSTCRAITDWTLRKTRKRTGRAI